MRLARPLYEVQQIRVMEACFESAPQVNPLKNVWITLRKMSAKGLDITTVSAIIENMMYTFEKA